MLSQLIQTSLQTTNTVRDPYAPAQFSAGWLYGLTYEDRRDEIVNCFKSDDNLTDSIYDAMEAYITGDSKTGDQKMF